MTDLMLLLHVASHTLETELAARLSDIGVSPRANCVLSKALEAERSQTELAELCNLDKTTMVVTMDHLEQQGWAVRTPSKTDRRARVIEVTPAGREVVAQAAKVVAEIYADVLSSLDPVQRNAFVEGLSSLVAGRLSTPVQCDKPPRRRAVVPK